MSLGCLVAMATAATQSTMQDYSKRTRIVVAWLLSRDSRDSRESLDFNRQKAADSLQVSYEYLRQVFADLESDEREMVADHEMEAAQDKRLQAEVAQRLRDAGAINAGSEVATTVEVGVEELQEEIQRLSTLEQSARRGDEERAWVAGSAREFLESLVETK